MMGDVGKRTYAKRYCKIKIGRTNTFQKETCSFENATLICNQMYPLPSLSFYTSSMTGSSQWSSWSACCEVSQQEWSTCQTWTMCTETWLPVTSWSTVIWCVKCLTSDYLVSSRMTLQTPPTPAPWWVRKCVCVCLECIHFLNQCLKVLHCNMLTSIHHFCVNLTPLYKSIHKIAKYISVFNNLICVKSVPTWHI